MDITRRPGMKVELWVKDSGEFDGFAVYLDGNKIATIVDDKTRSFALPETNADLKVTVQFGGNDGGVSAIVHLMDDNNQSCLGKQRGMRHEYKIKTEAP